MTTVRQRPEVRQAVERAVERAPVEATLPDITQAVAALEDVKLTVRVLVQRAVTQLQYRTALKARQRQDEEELLLF